MSTKQAWPWALISVLIVGLGIGVPLWLGQGASHLAIASFAVSLIAATVIIVTLVRQEHASAQLGQLANDMRRLAELTEGSVEEARSLRAEPGVAFLVNNQPSDRMVWKRTVDDRAIDRQAILASERYLALGTLPEQGSSASGEGTLGQVGHNIEQLTSMLGFRAITQKDRDDFAQLVEEYLGRLNKWLETLESWRRENPYILHEAYFQFQNSGRVPARDVRVFLRLPSSIILLKDLPDHPPPPPARPAFIPPDPFGVLRTLAGLETSSILGLGLPASYLSRAAALSQPNLGGPWIDEVATGRVEFRIAKLLHQVPVDSDEAVYLKVEEDGIYEVTWELFAENLVTPAKGALSLEVHTEHVGGDAVMTLEGVTATLTQQPGVAL
jgi:hypothetical protein